MGEYAQFRVSAVGFSILRQPPRHPPYLGLQFTIAGLQVCGKEMLGFAALTTNLQMGKVSITFG